MKTTPDIYVMPYISGSFLLKCNNKDGIEEVYTYVLFGIYIMNTRRLLALDLYRRW